MYIIYIYIYIYIERERDIIYISSRLPGGRQEIRLAVRRPPPSRSSRRNSRHAEELADSGHDDRESGRQARPAR